MDWKFRKLIDTTYLYNIYIYSVFCVKYFGFYDHIKKIDDVGIKSKKIQTFERAVL